MGTGLAGQMQSPRVTQAGSLWRAPPP